MLFSNNNNAEYILQQYLANFNKIMSSLLPNGMCHFMCLKTCEASCTAKVMGTVSLNVTFVIMGRSMVEFMFLLIFGLLWE